MYVSYIFSITPYYSFFLFIVCTTQFPNDDNVNVRNKLTVHVLSTTNMLIIGLYVYIIVQILFNSPYMSFHINYTSFYLTPCVAFINYAHILAYLHDDRITQQIY